LVHIKFRKTTLESSEVGATISDSTPKGGVKRCSTNLVTNNVELKNIALDDER